MSRIHERQYFCCLEDWSNDIREAGDHKECWYAKMKDKGLRVKIAENDKGEACGMIQYLPVEISSVEGHDLYFVLCIWVHGHRQGIGNFQKKGLGKSLLQAAEADVRQLGGKGLVTWGIILPFFMRAGWYKKQGYKVVDKSGMMRLPLEAIHNGCCATAVYEAKRASRIDPGKSECHRVPEWLVSGAKHGV